MGHPLERWTGPFALLAMAALAGTGVALYRPPEPVPAAAADTVFAAGRAMADVEAIAAAPRPVGAPAHDRVRSYVLGRLRELGLQVDTQTTTLVVGRGAAVDRPMVRNVMGWLPGTDPTGAVVLMAHYDGVPLSPAAADDAQGVAVVLETVRALRARGALRNNVLVLITDAEEEGLYGARAFAQQSPWMDSVSVVVNFEARGDRGPSLMFETGPESGWVIRELTAAVKRPLASSLFQQIYRYLPNDTDLTVFNRRGVAGLNFANGEGAEVYHQALDTPGRLSRSTLQHHGNNALAVASRLGMADLTTPRAPDLIYFYVPGAGLVHYGAGWAIPLALLLLALTGVVVVRGARAGRLRFAGVLAGLGGFVVASAAAAGVAFLIWRLAAAVHPEAGSVIGRTLYREGAYALAVVAVVVALVPGALLLLRRRFGAASLALGALLAPVAVAVVSALAAPLASHVLLWPSVFGLAMLGYLVSRPEDDGGEPGVAGVQLIMAPGSVLLTAPLVFLVYVFLGIAAAPVMAVLTALCLATVLPLLDAFGRPNRWWLPATAGATAVGLVLVGLLGAGTGPDRPSPSHLVYLLDRAGAEPVAGWVTGQSQAGPWLQDLFGQSATDSVDLWSMSSVEGFRRARRVAAPVVAWPAPAVRVLQDTVVAADRTLRLEVTWPESLVLGSIRLPYDDDEAGVVAVDGQALDAERRRVWVVRAWNPQRPVRVTVRAPAGADVRVFFTAHRAGLPALDGAPPPRPADVMPASRLGGVFGVSDVTLVRDARTF